MILASLQDYVPLREIWQIIVVCLVVAVVAPAAAVLAITGFEAQANARATGASRISGDIRVAAGAVVLIGLGVAGILALLSD